MRINSKAMVAKRCNNMGKKIIFATDKSKKDSFKTDVLIINASIVPNNNLLYLNG